MKRERHEHNNHIANEEEKNNNDIISDLPDSVLLHILSFLKTKEAVQTSILSTRWKNLWKHLSILTLYSSHFKTLRDFFRFVSRILFLRDDSTAIHTLDINRRGIIEPHLLKKIIKYAVSHNVRLLKIDVGGDIHHFPTCLFSCHTLTSLDLYVRHRISGQRTLFPYSLNLPSLTHLSLDSFAFPVENDGRANPFSALKRLNSLIIDDCIVLDAQKLCISSDRLTDLTVQTTFESCFCEIELSTPSLCTFDFTGIPYQKLRGSHLSSIKQVNFDANIMENPTKPPSVLLSWLLELTGIKSLRVTSTTLQVLSLVPNLLKVEFPSMCNLKSLKVKRKEISYELSKSLLDANFAKLPTGASYTDVVKLWETFSEGSSSIPDGIVEFLLQNSPSAEVDIIN